MKKFTQNLLNNDTFFIILFLSPALFGILIFIFIPLISSFILSFCDWNLLSDITFVGLDNYKSVLFSPDFHHICKNTLIFAVTTTVFGVLIPLILASVLNTKIRGSEFFKTVYFLPFITPMVVLAIVWAWIFDPSYGLVNSVLKSNLQWLYDKNLAMVVVIFVSVWKLIGYNMVIFLTGLSSINSSLFESAKIDGASPAKIFFNITIPQLSPIIFFVMIITTISSFQVFDLIYLMTQGGPSNSTNVLVYLLYQNAFEYFDIGQASAIAYLLFVIIFVLTLAQWKLKSKWVNED